MPLNGTEIYKNRVGVTCTVTGTSDYTGFTVLPTCNASGFASFADGTRVVCAIIPVDSNGTPVPGGGWEVGVCVVGTSGTVLARADAEILDGSNAGARVSWGASSLVRIACVDPAQTKTAGGDLTGSYPFPSIGAGKVTNTMLAGSIDLTAKVTGVLPVANGGTGSSTALAASNGEAIKSATQNLTGTAYQDVTDLSVTLPAVGTYLVSVSIYGSVLGSGGNPRMTCNLNLNGSDITDSEFAVVQGINSTSKTATGTRTYVVTAAGAHTLKVQAKRTMSGGAWTTSSITSNSDGKSALMWIRLA